MVVSKPEVHVYETELIVSEIELEFPKSESELVVFEVEIEFHELETELVVYEIETELVGTCKILLPMTANTYASSSRSHMEYDEQFNMIDEMVGDAFGVNVTYDEPGDFYGEEFPNDEVAFNTSYSHSPGEQASTDHIHAYFPAWFKEQLSCIVAPTQEILHLRNLFEVHVQSVNEWNTYFVKGYKFHTETWTEGKKTINTGMFVKGVTYGGEDDFYGVVTLI
ncbi:hypothetical protein KIW84_057298 [Lathyrus oleraceus]|uniref:Uncharacterized protein n=1 Tax=Pisum sativum TaxID=3888 RepID=A0A9D4X2W0_PEA|nr:hypothetical protein KIW84_057298 [Pisum sativum]